MVSNCCLHDCLVQVQLCFMLCYIYVQKDFYSKQHLQGNQLLSCFFTSCKIFHHGDVIVMIQHPQSKLFKNLVEIVYNRLLMKN